MLQFLPVFDGNTIAIRASGKLTHQDYQEFLPKLEEQIKQMGKVSVLLELDNFSGWDLAAAKDDFKFGMEHLDDFERMAIVGDKAWERWMALMAKPFLSLSSGEVKYFNREDLHEAWDWLREKQILQQAAEELLPYQTIVAAVDFSIYSKHAAKRAIEIARYYKASLKLLNVVQEIVPYAYYYGDSLSAYYYDPKELFEQNEFQLQHGKQQMENFMKDIGGDFPIETEVLLGDVDSTIVSYLEAQNTDLAVFGAKKRKGLGKLLGSTPHYVQNHIRCETLIVPLQEPSF